MLYQNKQIIMGNADKLENSILFLDCTCCILKIKHFFPAICFQNFLFKLYYILLFNFRSNDGENDNSENNHDNEVILL